MIKKITQFIKENLGFIIFLVLFYFVMNFELPYIIYTPGGAINLSERISGDNIYKEDGSFSMTYVSIVRAKVPFMLLSYVIPDWDAIPKEKFTYDDNDVNETLEIDKIYMQEAISNAEEAAYKAAGIEYKEKSTENIVTYVSSKAKTKLKHGDVLIDVDGIELVDIKVLQDYIKTKSAGDKIEIKYSRDGKEYIDEVTLITLNKETKAGISMAKVKKFETDYSIDVKTKASESGPSGGLMTTLAIYNAITEEDITKGKKIMGTGTIESDGKVGEIGGVKYKLIGAVKSGADVFICPVKNYDEAQSVAKKKNYNIKIISAETFQDALDKIKAL